MQNSKKVLIVEDSPTQQLMYKHKFSDAGFDVKIVENGLSALMHLRDNQPDIMIVDYVLPSMDGLELCKEVKAMHHLHNLPMIITSEARDTSLFEKAQKMGINKFIPKDEGPDYLIVQVKELLASTSNRAPYILIVEDSLTQAAYLKYLLERNGLAAINAGDGKTALEEIKKHKPEIILSDIRMPGIDGMELCHILKNDQEFMNIPLVLMTAISSTEDIIKAIASGADYYFPKPYNDQYLIDKIKSILADKTRNFSPSKPFEYEYKGKKYLLPADRVKVMELLFSTIEIAADQNKNLNNLQLELRRQKEHIERSTSKFNHELKEEAQQRNSINSKLEKQSRILTAVSNAAAEMLYNPDAQRNIQLLLDNITHQAGFLATGVVKTRLSSDGNTLITKLYCEKILAPSQEKIYTDKREISFDDSMRRFMDSIENHQVISTPVSKLPEAFRKNAQQRNANHVTAIPVITDGKCWGIFFLASEYPCDPEIVEVMKIATNLIASAIQHEQDKKQLIQTSQQELAIGNNIQQQLLISQPPTEIKGIDIAQVFIVADMISGNFTEYFELSQHSLDMIIANISGRDIPEGLICAAVKNTAIKVHHKCSFKPSFRPSTIVNMLQQKILSNLDFVDKTVMMAFCRIDTRNMEITITDCGYPHIIHFDSADKKCNFIIDEGLPVAQDPKSRYGQETFSANSGDLMIFISACETDPNDPAAANCKDAMEQIISKNADKTAQELADIIRDTIIGFNLGKEETDLTIVVAKING